MRKKQKKAEIHTLTIGYKPENECLEFEEFLATLPPRKKGKCIIKMFLFCKQFGGLKEIRNELIDGYYKDLTSYNRKFKRYCKKYPLVINEQSYEIEKNNKAEILNQTEQENPVMEKDKLEIDTNKIDASGTEQQELYENSYSYENEEEYEPDYGMLGEFD